MKPFSRVEAILAAGFFVGMILLSCCPSYGQQIYTLCASGCAYSNAQTAIDAAVTHQGSSCELTIIEARAGETFTGNFTLGAKTCAQYILIRSSRYRELPIGQRVTPSDAAKMALFRSTNSSSVFITSGLTRYWALDGIEVTQGSSTVIFPLILFGLTTENQWDSVPDHFRVSRVYGHGPDNAAGPVRIIYASARNITVEDSDLRAKYNSNDSQAIYCSQACDGLTSINNRLEATGENFMLGGNAGDGNSNVNLNMFGPGHIVFRSNLSTKRADWKRSSGSGAPAAAECMPGSIYLDSVATQWYTCNAAGTGWATSSAPTDSTTYSTKNHYELKHGRSVRFVGNLFRYSWNSAQGGNLFLLNQTAGTIKSYDVEDVIVEHNRGEWMGAGIGVGNLGSGGTLRSAKRISVNNLLLIKYGYNGATTVGSVRTLAPHRMADFSATNITADTGGTHFLSNNSDAASAWEGNFAVTNSAIGSTPTWGWITGVSPGTGWCGLRNVVMAAGGSFDFRAIAVVGSTTIGTSCTGDPVTGLTGPNLYTGTQPASAAALFESPTGTSGNYRIKAGSPAEDAGTDGRDIGADVDMIDGATSTIDAGTVSTWHSFQIRGVAPTSDGAVIQFTAPTSSACTWSASTVETFASTLGSVLQDRAGLSGSATISGLSARSAYYARVACGTYTLRTRFVTTP